MRPWLVTLLVLYPLWAAAEDVAAVAAALRDQASECRYFAQRCEVARRAKERADAWMQKSDAAKAAPPDPQGDKLASDKALVAEGAFVIDRQMTAIEELVAVQNVIRAKHAKPPECLRCPGVLK